MGPHGFGRGSYSFWSLEKPFKGPLYKVPWVVGGIHNPVIDPTKHFNMQDRFITLTFGEYLKCLLYPLLGARAQWVMAILPVSAVMFIVWMEQRREPMEIFMDREEYFKDADSIMYGVYFDHHHFAHMLAHRRQNKWGYAGKDIYMEAEGH